MTLGNDADASSYPAFGCPSVLHGIKRGSEVGGLGPQASISSRTAGIVPNGCRSSTTPCSSARRDLTVLRVRCERPIVGRSRRAHGSIPTTRNESEREGVIEDQSVSHTQTFDKARRIQLHTVASRRRLDRLRLPARFRLRFSVATINRGAAPNVALLSHHG